MKAMYIFLSTFLKYAEYEGGSDFDPKATHPRGMGYKLCIDFYNNVTDVAVCKHDLLIAQKCGIEY